MSLSKPVIFETTFTSYTGTGIIGKGGAGCVYRATDDAENVYAIKLLDAAKANREKVKRFKNEVEFSLKNRHQNIITVINHGGVYRWQEAFSILRYERGVLYLFLKRPVNEKWVCGKQGRVRCKTLPPSHPASRLVRGHRR
jgi:serine/threonine protein kinase